MVEISNETLCMLVVVFIIVLILFNMGRSDQTDQKTPCGSMKISSKFQNPIAGVESTEQNNPFVNTSGKLNVNSPYGIASGFPNPISGNGNGGNFYFGNINPQVNANRIGTKYIYPPDVKNPKYIAAFGISKGINEISGKPYENEIPLTGPFSMRIMPSQSLTKN
jgi:hypothetical protein